MKTNVTPKGRRRGALRLKCQPFFHGQAMDTFLSIHQDDIVGTLSMFDRMIFRGYLTGFFPKGAFGAYLSRQGVLLKDFRNYVQSCTQELKAHIESLAQEAGRPVQYLPSAKDASKEELARKIA